MPQSRELLAVLPSGPVDIQSFLTTSRQAGPRHEFVLVNEGGSMTKGSTDVAVSSGRAAEKRAHLHRDGVQE